MVRRFLQALALVATLVVGTTAAVIIVSQTAWFKDWLRGFIVRQANEYLNGQLSIARLDGNLFFGVELENVTLTSGGQPAVSVKDVGLDYSVFDLASGGIALDDIRLNEPVVHLRRTAEGWNLSRLVRKQSRESDRTGPGRPITIGSIGISDGTLVVDDATERRGTIGTSGTTAAEERAETTKNAGALPSRIDRLDLKAAFSYSPVNYTVDIAHVSFQAHDPDLALRSFSGRISTRQDALYFDRVAIRTAESALSLDGAVTGYTTRPVLDLHASSDKVALAEIGRLVPAVANLRLQPSFDVRAKGPLDRLTIVAETRSGAGEAAGDLVADLAAPGRRFAGTVRLAHFNYAPLVRASTTGSDITGTAKVDMAIVDRPRGGPLAFLEGTYQVEAPRVVVAGYDVREVRASGRIAKGVVHVDGRGAAYGGRATAVGTVEPGPPFRLDLRGRARNVDVRQLPASLHAPRMATDVTAGYHVAGTFGAAGHLVVDAAFEPSTIAGGRLEQGSTARVTLDAGRLGYEADGRVADLDLQRIGQGLAIEALSADRYRTSLAGAFSVRGSGTTLATLALDANADLRDSSLFGGTVPAMHVVAGVHDGGLHVVAKGSFAGFDPATLSGQPRLAGRVSGTADVDATLRALGGPLSADTVAASGRLTLADSRVGDTAITQALVEGEFANGAGDLKALHVKGPDVSLDASGHVDLGTSGASKVAYTLELPNLAAVGRAAGQDLSGIATVEGTLAGNARELSTAGTLHVSSLRAPSTSVLSATSQFTVRLPELDPRRAQVTADTTAALVEAAGMKLTEARVKTTWHDQLLGIDATLRDQSRTLTAAGDVLLHPDHQEVHLRDLALRTSGEEWRTEPGRESAIQYAGGRVHVDHLALVNGPQRIDAEGAFGQPGDEMRVKASGVDLAAVDRLALGTGTISGRLDASAVVGGTREAPRADARFSIAGGSVRGFRYASFGGSVGYDPSGIRIDARLDQAPGAWIAAKGTVPAAALRSEPGGHVPGTHDEPAPGESMDVAVTSSALDLAIIEGFTPVVTKVSGTVQADVHVLGTVDDPHLSGHVDVKGGAFTVEDLTAGGYTGLDTRIEFQPDRVHIAAFQVLDEHRHRLRVAGDLAVHQRQVGKVQIAVQSEQFEIVDNELADVKLTTDLRVTGELSAPRVEGNVAVHTGTVNVDRLLDTLSSNAYAEAPTAMTDASGVTPAASAPGAGPTTTTPGPGGNASPPPAGDQPAKRASAYDALALDVRLQMPDNLVVKGNDLNPSGASPVGLGNVNVTLGGDLRATKAPGAPVRLVGTVNTVRGTYDFQGRRFDIERDGRIQFVGGNELNPRLDVTATRVISGVQAQVHVRGSARRPQLTLSSQPPLDEADILSLIVFNQPANSLGEGEQVSLASRAGALASGFVASSLAKSIGSALELDVLDVQTTPENGGGPSVTIGEQVGERLFVKLRQAFGAQSVTELVLEYQLARFLRLQTSVAEGAAATERTLMHRVEQGGVDLIFYYQY